MANDLHLPARPGAPIACDMSTAVDTPDERLAEYGRLFEAALVRRERPERGVVFVFRDTPGTRAKVEDLARREMACCPFMDYRVETVGDEVVYTLTNPVAGANGADIDTLLDAVYALPGHAGPGASGLLDRIADAGVDIVEAGTGRFGWRRSPAG